MTKEILRSLACLDAEQLARIYSGLYLSASKKKGKLHVRTIQSIK
jgi:hypothetical protein